MMYSKTSPIDMLKKYPAKTMDSRSSRRDRRPFLSDFIKMCSRASTQAKRPPIGQGLTVEANLFFVRGYSV